MNIINFLKNNIKKYLVSSTTSENNPVLIKNFLNLEIRLQKTIHFLKKKSIYLNGEKIKLNDLPWYLLIGSAGAGKTTLLANSNINFILDKKHNWANIKSISHSENCDWWVTHNAVLIDVPGNYIAYKAKMISLPNKLWRHFLTLIKIKRGPHGINGIIIALSLAELLDKQNREELIEKLNYRIAELRNKFGHYLQFYFTITKCDLLPGFLEFFNDYDTHELAQSWGITIPPLDENEKLSDVFIDRFDALIKRLNNQLIWRLHQERNVHAKLYIKDFPLQLERFKKTLADILNGLAKLNPSFCLKGVYLTSAIQNPLEEQTLAYPQIISANEAQRALDMIQKPNTPEAFFIKQFILQALIPTYYQTRLKNEWRPIHIVYSVILSAMVITAIFHKDIFFPRIQSTQQNTLTNYQTSHNNEIHVADNLSQSDKHFLSPPRISN